NHQGVVVGLGDLGESRIEAEVVTRLLGVGLIPFKVMDGGAHSLPGLLVWAHGMHLMTHGLQRLERDHDLVVLDEVAHQHQDSLPSHLLDLSWNQAVVAISRACVRQRLVSSILNPFSLCGLASRRAASAALRKFALLPGWPTSAASASGERHG